MNRERWAIGFVLTLTFAIRAIHADQPIVENYVGRQIPTAMVARNLERGSGFLRPQLDTGPFPNLFLVEPPIYAQVVVSARNLVGFDLEPTGRIISALATTLGAWGLFGLARRREGFAVALVTGVAFAAFPVMVRYGRAFQPDALMVGFVLAGLHGWDEFQESGDRRWAVFGGFVLSIGLALKITSAWTLLPFVLVVTRLLLVHRVGFVLLMLTPGMAWYAYAWGDVHQPGAGSLASSANASIWLRTLSPTAWVRFATYENFAKAFAYQAFTPIGFVLAIWGWLQPGRSQVDSKSRPRLDRLWVGWGIGCLLSMVALAAKWHHAYYWMVVAPLMAVGAARGFVWWVSLRSWVRWVSGAETHWPDERGLAFGGFRFGSPTLRYLPNLWIGFVLAVGFLGLCVVQSAPTWRTPAEWSGLIEAARELNRIVPADHRNFVVAPEALLYYAERRGFRLEFDPEASRRAAEEWGLPLGRPDQPLALIEFYARHARDFGRPTDWKRPEGIDVAADVGLADADHPRRLAWRSAIRAVPGVRIRVDRPDALIVSFDETNPILTQPSSALLP